ncbi:MAG: hypothetical protein ACREVV_10170 [Steroidobacteraceae bacterium]
MSDSNVFELSYRELPARIFAGVHLRHFVNPEDPALSAELIGRQH